MQRSESEERKWLVRHAQDVLRSVGIAPGHTVLDFGCGEGPFALPAARLVGDAGTVHALDRDGDKLAALTARAEDAGLGNIRTIQTGGELRVSLPDGSCGCMLLYDVLQGIDDWHALFAEALRVLWPGGTLSIYPMHVERDRVTRECSAAGFRPVPGPDALLNFVKPATPGARKE